MSDPSEPTESTEPADIGATPAQSPAEMTPAAFPGTVLSDPLRRVMDVNTYGHPLNPTVEGPRARRMTNRDTLVDVAQAISVRLDDDSERALRALEATGLSRSDAIRTALIDAAGRLRSRVALAAEVAELEADEADRAEMSAVTELMESLRAQG